ncbi:outer membrane protein assembly factor [Cellulophaga sp. 20_2_10]|uniref:outer membrane protein assembly factor n=1 Tax=Cellulophaga sp. 20_2_10 TaxID=2942476 RepID=UPI00201ACBB8|nr:outer membrane protein assembly factor [Cellulophaga sp. 20_2_10]MCL5247155.1 outer membrane protein assembly factor [Cellulophaga sp. 20_2_10]
MKKLLFLFLILFCVTGFSQELKIADVSFVGAKKTKVSFLKSIVAIEKGILTDSSTIRIAVNQLKKLPSIANATFQLVQNTVDTSYNLVFTVEENFTIIPFANLYTSSNDDFAFRVGLQEFNFTGRNITVGGFYQKDIFNSYGVLLRAPYLFSAKAGLAVSYNNLKTQEPIFFDGSSADYKYHNSSIEVLGLYQFNQNHSIDLGLNFFTEKYNYIRGATNETVPQALDVNKFSYKAIYKYSNIQYHYQYLDGFKSSLNFQYVHSSTKELDNFVVAFNDFVYYKRVGERGNWANRLRVGLATNDETPFAPFSVDNNINIRGVGNIIDRGTGALVLNTEYRYTLVDKSWFVLQGNTFVDAGTWRNPGGEFQDFLEPENIRVYPGVGLRFMHKKIFNAIFRIDYGYGVTKNASKGLVFGIGQYF